ncbi:MAG: DUF72 domain-containing protein [Pseudomonadota bacterium]
MHSPAPPIALGLPQWYHAAWSFTPRSDDALSRYSRHFDTVEGNTTFYGLPSADTVTRWQHAVPARFRFCFKFPRSISHDAELQHCDDDTRAFLERLAPLGEQLDLLWLQLGPRFGPDNLPRLQSYLRGLPTDFHYAVEVRHPAFFAKGEDEAAFNRLLADCDVNRTVFDTRTLFANPAPDADTQEAMAQKPRVPTHAVATASRPMVRIISPRDTTLAQSALARWADVLLGWHRDGHAPRVFLHTPSCAEAPALAAQLAAELHARDPAQPPLAAATQPAEQGSLF